MATQSDVVIKNLAQQMTKLTDAINSHSIVQPIEAFDGDNEQKRVIVV